MRHNSIINYAQLKICISNNDIHSRHDFSTTTIILFKIAVKASLILLSHQLFRCYFIYFQSLKTKALE